MSDSITVVSEHRGASDNLVKAWMVCFSAGLFFFYEFFQLNLFDVINYPLRVAFQIDAAQLSWMSSTFLWADILFLIPAGIILDRFATRRVILISLLLCILATVGFAMTTSFAWACFFHALTGIGNAFCFLACVILVSRWFPPRRQAFVMGSIVTMAFLGGMAAHTPFAYLNQHYGWRNALFIDALLGVLIFIEIAWVIQDYPSSPINRKTQTKSYASWAELRSVLLCWQNTLAGLYTCCLNLPIMVICALWGASYLQIVHHLSPLSASNIVSMIFMGSIIGCPLIGWLSDRDGRRKPIMLIGAVATLIVVTVLLRLTHISEAILSLLFFSLGFVSSTQVISYPLIAESNSPRHTGFATSIASTIIIGGAAVGQIIFGALVQHHAHDMHTYTTIDFQLAMMLFPIATMIALLSALFVRETYCKSTS